MIILTWHLTKVDHLKVSATTRSLTLSSIHAPPLVLDLHEHRNLAEHTRNKRTGITVKNAMSYF